MIYLFWVLLLTYTIILLLRFYLSNEYYKLIKEKTSNKNNEYSISLKEITIFQPILSGDKYLEEKLSYIYNNIEDAQLIWAVNKSDAEAERIVNKITGGSPKENLYIDKTDDSPFNINPKVYKIIQSEKMWRKYTVILDDDTVIDIKKLESIDKRILENNIITGIPYYKKSDNIYGNLVRAYVNSNSVYTYFALAKLRKNKTINGMFYIFKSEKIILSKLYEEIKFKLCDDYEFAKAAVKKGLNIHQAVIPCKINTEVNNPVSFFRLMRRWHVFINYYVKQNLDISVTVFSILPFVSGILFLTGTFFCGYKLFLFYILILLIFSLLSKKLREEVFDEKENFRDMLLEVFSNFIQIFYWLPSIIKPNQIIWRGKLMNIKNGEVEIK